MPRMEPRVLRRLENCSATETIAGVRSALNYILKAVNGSAISIDKA